MADTSKLAKADIKGGARVAAKGPAKAAAAAAAEGEDYAPTGLDDRFQTTGDKSNSQLILCVRSAGQQLRSARPRGAAWLGGGGRSGAQSRQGPLCLCPLSSPNTPPTRTPLRAVTREPDRTLIIGFIFIAVVLGFHFCGFLFREWPPPPPRGTVGRQGGAGRRGLAGRGVPHRVEQHRAAI